MHKHKQAVVVTGCLLGCALIVGLAMIIKPKDPACVRLEAKAALARDFCDGLAAKAADERCSALADDPEVKGQCMRVVIPAATVNCMAYLNIEHIKEDLRAACP